MIFKLRAQSIAVVLSTAQHESLSRRTAFRISALIVLLYVIGTLLTVVSAQRAAWVLFDTDVSSTLAAGDIALDRLEDDLGTFNFRFRRMKTWIFPIRQVAKLAVVIGPLERQRKGLELLLERVELNQDAAVSAIALGRSTFVIRDLALDGLGSVAEPENGFALKESLPRFRSDSVQVLANLEHALSVGIQFDELGVGGPIGSLNDRIVAQERQLGQLADFSLLLSDVLLADLDLLAQMNSTFEDLGGFLSGELSIGELSYLVDELASQSQIIRDKSVKMASIAPKSVMESEYGAIVQSLRDLNVSAHGLISGISTVLDVGVAAIDTLSSVEGPLFENGHAISDTLLVLIEKEEELASSVRLINRNLAALLEISDTGRISLGALGDVLEDRVEPLLKLSALFEGPPRIAADLFGVDGEERRYLLLGQTSDELRAAGGFTSSIWLLTFQGGALVSNEYIEIDTVEDLDTLGEYPEAYEALQLHMDAGRMYLRDVGWDPHFPNVGNLATDLYEIRHINRVDGVISLSQWAFVDLVTVFGGIKTESGFVGASDLLSVIEQGTDDEGTEFLDPMFDALLASLSGENIRTHGVSFLMTLKSLAESKDLMFYSENPVTQSLISEIGWNGGIPNSTRDRLVIVDSNVGWNKVDRQIDRQFTYEVDLTNLAEPTAQLNIEYTNDSAIDANTCDIQAHVGNIAYETRLHGCYWNYLRVYVPLGAQLVGGDDLPLEEGSIAARFGGLTTGSRTVRQLFDDNGSYISGLMALNPQSSRDVTLYYTLPSTVVEKSGQSFEYILDVVVQAGTRGRTGSVVVTLPDGYEVIEVESAAIISSSQVVIRVDPARDETIRLKFGEISASAG